MPVLLSPNIIKRGWGGGCCCTNKHSKIRNAFQVYSTTNSSRMLPFSWIAAPMAFQQQNLWWHGKTFLD